MVGWFNFNCPLHHSAYTWWRPSQWGSTSPPPCPDRASQAAGCICLTRPTAQCTSPLSTSHYEAPTWSEATPPTLRSVQQRDAVSCCSTAHLPVVLNSFGRLLQGQMVFEHLKQLESKGVELQIAVNAPQTSTQDTAELAATGTAPFNFMKSLYMTPRGGSDLCCCSSRRRSQRSGPESCDRRHRPHQTVGGGSKAPLPG